jgi:hypothetical protein
MWSHSIRICNLWRFIIVPARAKNLVGLMNLSSTSAFRHAQDSMFQGTKTRILQYVQINPNAMGGAILESNALMAGPPHYSLRQDSPFAQDYVFPQGPRRLYQTGNDAARLLLVHFLVITKRDPNIIFREIKKAALSGEFSRF